MRLLLISMLLALFSCSGKTDKKTIVSTDDNLRKDTVIAKTEIINELAGSRYRKRADSYFMLFGSDTSSFKPVFSEAINNGTVSLSLNIPYSKSTVSYNQRLFELNRILDRAKQDYSLDSLTTVSFGRLILSGDLAIEMTREYKEQFGQTETITTDKYKEIRELLLKSTLSKDLNQLFKPYRKSVNRIEIEKAFFTTKEELLAYSQITQDTSLMPDRIIDFMIWIELENK